MVHKHAIHTLRHRLAALAGWHRDQGFADPTKAPIVRKALKGIRMLHPAVEKQATPLQLTQLGAVSDWLTKARDAAERGDEAADRRFLRDRALVLLGVWRGFRGDVLLCLRVKHIVIDPGQGLSCFLPFCKDDRENPGRTFKAPALARWCPVEATGAWLSAGKLTEGPLFRRIDRWGGLAALSKPIVRSPVISKPRPTYYGAVAPTSI